MTYTFWEVNAILTEGFISTCKLFFLTLLGALPLGLVICFGAMSNWAPFAGLADKNGSKMKRVDMQRTDVRRKEKR